MKLELRKTYLLEYKFANEYLTEFLLQIVDKSNI